MRFNKPMMVSALVVCYGVANAAEMPKEATAHTKAYQQSVKQLLSFDNKDDFTLAQKGLIDKEESLVIKDADGRVVWDMDQYANFLGSGQVSPDTVNPSLWRMAQLNMLHGLFKVHDKIFQVRGYDLAVMTIIETNTGYVVVDPLISAETAKAAMAMVYDAEGEKPIKAVIYTHSHVDHFGGVKGLVSDQQVKDDKVQIIAPNHFMHHAVSENVMAGNAMLRRAQYMYGSLLPKSPRGQVDGGLAKTTSTGTITLISPTKLIKQHVETMNIDGVDFEFQ